ncbi:acyl-CoA dehydrogenase [Nocardioides antri]|uniref:Acyl-CoA dehydrogenase n=1 Tax=Nocardioides antri TaxID=2607659 RepID=A0A5B1M5B4_9ACTN|nr:acyl-CoA dehydrogenase [Nocardioides antri]KAA1427678.1 acyl-CoA dehydrogenase [Nocardioides antri]
MARTSYDLGIGLTDEHIALADAVRSFADSAITSDLVRKDIDARSADKFPPFWPALVGQDLLGLHVPEDMGGSGGGLLTLAVALEALGRTAAPGPFVPTVLATALFAAGDCKADVDLLPGLLDGSRTAAVALALPSDAADAATSQTVSGTYDAVLGAEHADVVLLPVRLEGECRWVAVDAADLAIKPQDSIDVVRGSARVVVSDLPLDAGRVIDHLDETRVRSIATVVLGAEAVGVISWCVSTAAEYARTRVQFGRPIGQFQGVKHKCAHMAIALEQARAAVWDAASAIDKGDATADYAADVAALVVPEAAVEVAQDCIQVHGGIGFTWEHDAHLFYRRALALRALFGSREERAARVADQALAGVSRSLELELPEEAEEIRATVRAELAGLQGLDDEEELMTRLGDGGWVQPHLPTPYGRAAGPLEQIVIGQELAAAGITLPQLLMGGWAVQAIVAHGTEQQKQALVVPTLRGQVVWCQLFSEPGAGSDLASLSTRAVKVEGGWQVTGQKVWTTVAQFSDWAMLIARTNPDKPKHEGITYFVLDMKSPGVTVRPLREMTGSALFNEVFLDDVFVPDEHVVGEVDHGWGVARTTLAGERVALSQKMDAYASDKDLLRFARGRELSPVARHQLGELVAESQSIDLISARIVLKQLSGADVSTASSVGKLLGMGMGQKIAEYVVATLGPAGVVSIPGERSDHAMEQLIAGRATTIYGGTTEVQLNVIGERMLGLPRDADR